MESRADWIANGVLYLPLGLLGVLSLLRRQWRAWAAVPLVVTTTCALALIVEFAQMYFPPRTVSLNDLLAEAIGTVLGACAALAIARHRSAFQRLGQDGRDWALAHALGLYAAAYVAYCLFPYDLLISADELRAKLSSALWGWWIAGDGGRPLITAVRLAIEVILTAPLGVLWARRSAVSPDWRWAALIGVLFGVAIEGGQLLIASGYSQGASVATRGLGMALGVVAWRARGRWPLAAVRSRLKRHRIGVVLAYLPLLLAVNGWLTSTWHGLGDALVELESLRYLPFYYHYYTTEAQALISLTSVAVMYAPVGLLAWAGQQSAVRAAAWAVLLSLMVEAPKLFLAGLHPDPTNLWIAAAAAAGVVMAAEWRPTGETADVNPAAVAQRSARGSTLRWAAAASLGLALAAVVVHVASGSPLAAATVVGVAVCAVVVWRQPAAMLLLVPALLPLLDLAPWTGRFVWDEFDLLMTVGLAVGYWRTPAAATSNATPTPAFTLWRAAFVMLVLSFAISGLIGAWPLAWPDASSLASYSGGANVFRIVKGVVWAALFIGLARRLASGGHAIGPPFAVGTVFGLLGVVTFVLWERAAFVGLFDLQSSYRVTGPFAAMHRGGAFVECYLAVATTLAAAAWLDFRGAWLRIAGAMLLAGAAYATAVTFSRNGYVAFGLALGLFALVEILRGARTAKVGGSKALAPLLALVIVASVGAPVLLGPFAQERLARWQQDLTLRQAHWADALGMRDDGLRTGVFGMGVGRFPDLHFWRSREASHASTVRVERDGDRRILRLGGGAPTYVDQFVSPDADRAYTLSARLRANVPSAALTVSVCKKWMLTSSNCSQVVVHSAAVPGAWVHADVPLPLDPAATTGWGPQPLKLALHSPAMGVVLDIDTVELRAADGSDLIDNGGFERGLDRWHFSTDIDPPWHIHSLPLTVLFDQGWFGALAWVALLATALVSGARRAWAGQRHRGGRLGLAHWLSGKRYPEHADR